jgi:hypothetical protein
MCFAKQYVLIVDYLEHIGVSHMDEQTTYCVPACDARLAFHTLRVVGRWDRISHNVGHVHIIRKPNTSPER